MVTVGSAVRTGPFPGPHRGPQGYELIGTNHMAANMMEWDGSGLPEAPSAPETVQQAGLTIGFLNDLLMRTLYTRGAMLGLDLARHVCLPFNVIEDSLRFLKD